MSTPAPAHILVVEDEAVFRQLAVRMLEGAGFIVTQADGFESALDIVERDPSIVLLLMDIGMPAGTPHGISIARMSQMRRAQMKIVYMTGGDAAGVTNYVGDAPVLQKPFAFSLLIKTVEDELSRA